MKAAATKRMLRGTQGQSAARLLLVFFFLAMTAMMLGIQRSRLQLTDIAAALKYWRVYIVRNYKALIDTQVINES